ncbi:MAG TPA: hypothetical protein VFI74_04800 [Candidatus Saccharimonadales bacterium]|nr:hypothetical protein [Candidatus Saccharimonadales bacterium]
MTLLKLLSGLTRDDERRQEMYRNLIRQEAKIGGHLFGPVAAGGRREFFCLDEYTWVWHEEWTDQAGRRHVVTTRYDVRPNGILKAQDDRPYQYIGVDEAKKLFQAVSLYNKQVDAELYAIAA